MIRDSEVEKCTGNFFISGAFYAFIFFGNITDCSPF